jgi:glyoxylase-like metal-dependent hydrolase (beta-lactamase superfamily II)
MEVIHIMKLYCFHVGSIAEPHFQIVIPIYAYLIEHPKGRILVDTGESYELRDENAVMEEKDTIISKLAELGYTPDDIGYVVISHMHLDHSGYMNYFPNSTFIARKEELKAAWWPEASEGGYLFSTYDKTRNFKFIQPADDEDYDIFMDGSVVLIDTRGHSRGHQSVVLNLPNTGKTVLTIDAAPTRESLERTAPRGFTDSWQSVRSLQKLKHLASCGYKMIFAHDPENPPEKVCPQYFE